MIFLLKMHQDPQCVENGLNGYLKPPRDGHPKSHMF